MYGDIFNDYVQPTWLHAKIPRIYQFFFLRLWINQWMHTTFIFTSMTAHNTKTPSNIIKLRLQYHTNLHKEDTYTRTFTKNTAKCPPYTSSLIIFTYVLYHHTLSFVTTFIKTSHGFSHFLKSWKVGNLLIP